MNHSQHPDLSQQNFYQPSHHPHLSSRQPQQYTMPSWGMMNQS
jgi:hypothetical protein